MKSQSGFIEIVVMGSTVLLAALATLIYILVAQPFKMSGASMMPTLENGEYFMANKMNKNYQRGDIVVFRNPKDDAQNFIKRIIGVPGDKLKVQDGKVYLNGSEFPELYVYAQNKTSLQEFIKEDQEITIPSDSYFLLGDNREHSVDSRGFGFIAKNKIIGKYWFSYSK